MEEMSLSKFGTYLRDRDASLSSIGTRIKEVLTDHLRYGLSDREEEDILRGLLQDLDSDERTRHVNTANRARFLISDQELKWLAHHDEAQWIPYLSYRYRFRVYPQLRKLTDFPPYVLIEPTSVCNLRCVFCFQVDKGFTKKPYMGLMSWELFTRVVDEVRDNDCRAVTLASRGEPTLHPRFGDMLRYLNDAGIMDVKINTNATRLSEELCHDILSSEVSEVVFSVDASTKDTYEKLRVRGKFDEVVANIERFSEIRSIHYPGASTITRVAGVKYGDEQDLDHMQRFWEDRIDEVTMKEASPRWDTYNNERLDIVDPCTVLFERLYVWYDGTVNPCDMDYKSMLAVGNVNETSLKELWRGEKYEKLRAVHLAGERSCVIPCDRCPFK